MRRGFLWRDFCFLLLLCTVVQIFCSDKPVFRKENREAVSVSVCHALGELTDVEAAEAYLQDSIIKLQAVYKKIQEHIPQKTNDRFFIEPEGVIQKIFFDG